MILIWQGAGILVAVIWVFSIFAGDWLAKAVFGTEVSGGLCNLTGEWFAATLALGLALLVRKQRELRLDPDSGRTVEVATSHSLFFIPVIAWPVIFFALGIVGYFRAPAHAPAPLDVTPSVSTKLKQPVSTSGRAGAAAEPVEPESGDCEAPAATTGQDTISRLKELKRKAKAILEDSKATREKYKETTSKPRDKNAKE
jgi:hypothetical protein